MNEQAGGRREAFSFWVDGAPYSKANSRQSVRIGGVSRSIKSDNALRFCASFARQCPTLSPLFDADVHVDLDIYYPDRRRDLDESLVLDCMQGRIYVNDRQVKSRRVRWNLDRKKPGIWIHVRLARIEDYADEASFPVRS